MDFLRRKDFIRASILWLIFIVLTKVIPYLFIVNKVIYEGKIITLKADLFAQLLSWPISLFFLPGTVNSYFFLPVIFIYYLLLVILARIAHVFFSKRQLYKWIFASMILPIGLLRLYPNSLSYLDNGKPSVEVGTPGNGKLINGKRLLFQGDNFEYFNFFSYLRGNCYVHEKVKKVLLETYKTCEQTCPGIYFYTGEGSKQNGGPYIFNHRTHQSGTSIDLMLVYRKGNEQYSPISILNAYGYGINTDSKGTINKSIPFNYFPENVKVDYETNAKFLLALDDACKRQGLKIRIIIFKVDLKKHLFATSSGKKLLMRNIRFANKLSDMLDKAHDDHFHVDFIVPQ